MDPDLPLPSIEHDEPPNALRILSSNTREGINNPASIPLPPSSPPKSPYKPSKSYSPSLTTQKISRSPSVTSSHQLDAPSSPVLRTKRSSPNLDPSRGATPSRTQYRRASSNLNPASPSTSIKPLSGGGIGTVKPVAWTTSSVAKEYFQKELAQHSASPSNVAVIVHDSCYGHRFSRPRTSKTNLSLIVERPERIQATILGASTAYVRLGSRHANGSCGPHPDKNHVAEKGIPFEIRKTSRFVPLNHAAVTYVHGTKWMEELQIMCDSAAGKLAINGKELVRPIGYGKDENGQPLPKLHEGDLYLCEASLSALQGCLGGVCDAVDSVLGPSQTERAFVCIRPPGHHCSSNFPSGFCWLNNVHVGISYAAMNYGLTHAAIIDFDLHHGDGSQAIAWEQNRKAHSAAKNAALHKKTAIGYYSLHDINSYPCEWGDEEKVKNASVCIDNAHGQSIWNVHLESWKTVDDFWKLYESKYKILLEKTRKFLRHHTTRLQAAGHTQPKAAIFISAGFDASEWEGAGMQRHQVNVPTEFYARFTRDIIELSKEPGLSVNGRVISVLEGGYSDRALTSGVLSHLCGLVQDEPPKTNTYGALNSMENGIGGLSLTPSVKSDQDRYSEHWWAPESLELLESLITGNLPTLPKNKDKVGGNYSSPTQASTARMTEQAKERRSLSAQLEARLSMELESPPPPDVEWTVASYELSRLIIPSDRQTNSCTHEELNAEATRAKKERQSLLALPSVTDDKMQLRDRRSKAPASNLERVRSSSRTSNRRTTIAAVSELPDPTMGQPAVPPLPRPRRRSSAGSSLLSDLRDVTLTDPNHTVSRETTMAPSSVTDNASRPIAVKKTRAAPTKQPIKPKNSPRKVATRPAVLARKTSSSSDKTAASDKRSVTSQSANDIKSDDLDDITNAMKKVSIKLKMPTEQEHAARQKDLTAERQKMVEGDNKKKPRVPRKPAVPRAIKPKTTVPGQPITAASGKPHSIAVQADNVAATQVPATEPDIPLAIPSAGATNDPLSDRDSSLPASQPSQFDPVRNTFVPAQESQRFPVDFPSHIVPHQQQRPTEVVSSANIMGQQQYTNANLSTSEAAFGIPWAPQGAANIATNNPLPQHNQTFMPPPMPNQQEPLVPTTQTTRPVFTPKKMTREDLPHFTSQSPIPFAQQQQNLSSTTHTKPEHKPSIWDIPDTPQH